MGTVAFQHIAHCCNTRGTMVAASDGMDIKGAQNIRLPQANTWEALNDPAIIRASVPGCDYFKQTGDNRYAVGILTTIGALSTRFEGDIRLFNLRPPEAYSMSFEGSGKDAGSVRGQAEISLVPEHLGTTLSYRASMQVNGPLAQAGERLLDEAARRMVEAFFARFKSAAEPGGPGIAAGEADVTEVAGGLWLAPVWSFLGGFGVALCAIIASRAFA